MYAYMHVHVYAHTHTHTHVVSQLAMASKLGKKIIPILVGPLPGMYHAPERSAGVALSGGGIWWPPRDDMGQYLKGTVPIDMFQAMGPNVVESESFRALLRQVSETVAGEMREYQRQSDAQYGAKHAEAALRQNIFTGSRLKSRAEWMLRGKNG